MTMASLRECRMAAGPRVLPVIRKSGMGRPPSRQAITGGKKAYCDSASTHGSAAKRRNSPGSRPASFQKGFSRCGGASAAPMISGGADGGGGAMARRMAASSVSE